MSDDSGLDGVAIIGMAGRFPGAHDVDRFWQNVKDGVESITFFSDGDLAEAGHDARALRETPGFVAARGIIDDPEWFDAPFFGMMPIEAEATDPQQRLMLEIAWQAMEHAGYDPTGYPGPVGVYAGVGANTYYLNFLLKRPDLLEIVGPMQELIGRDKDFVATRIAFKLNLKGPALSVNTACSTSLVTTCLAVQALQSYQCDLALAGGVSVVLPQAAGYLFEEEGILSPDGHTRAFDADAKGTVFSSGAAIVVLKRLADAVTDGDRVYAVIKGAALNNDGGDKASFTAPSADGHAEVIALAQAQAGVDPGSISYVETHGTATPIGDPIEIAGLTAAFRSATMRPGSCRIGSVKSNIGHLDIAAGVAGLIKTACALDEGVLPPSLHYHAPNPRIDFANTPFEVQRTLEPWLGPRPLRAGVSSFGVGGTNAHVILEEAPAQARKASDPSARWQLLVLSARTPAALDAATGDLSAWLREHPAVELADVAFTLQRGRHPFPHRRAVVCAGTEDLFRLGGRRQTFDGTAPAGRAPEVAFVCAAARFRQPDTIDARAAAKARIAWPVHFAATVALGQSWMKWGVTPTAIAGSGIGEVAAAVLAGAIAPADGVRVIETLAAVAERDARDDGSAAADVAISAALGRLRVDPPAVPVWAQSAAAWIGHPEMRTASYWRGLLPSRPDPADGSLATALGARVRLDLAPGGASDDAEADDRALLLASIGRLWTMGVPIDWSAVWSGTRRRRLALPTYPFERTRLSVDPRPARSALGHF